MEYFISLTVFTFVAGISPGPNTMMLMASGLNHGLKNSLPHYFGICIGFPLMVTAVGFGMETLFSAYPRLYLYIKVAGISYLLYLAWKIANAGNPKANAKIKAPFTFIQAAAFQWLNPKAWAIAVGALAAFTSKEHFVATTLAVISVYFVMGFICMGLWLLLGKSLRNFLNSGNRVKYFNIVMATLLLISVIPMAFVEH